METILLYVRMVNKIRRKEAPHILLITTNSLENNISPLLTEAEKRGMRKAIFVKKVMLKYAEKYPDMKSLVASLEQK